MLMLNFHLEGATLKCPLWVAISDIPPSRAEQL